MKKLIILLCIIAALSSCALFVDNSTGIEVYNEMSYDDIWYVYISESSDSDWGSDELGSTGTIAPGDSKIFPLSTGTWDIKLVSEDYMVGELYEIEVDSGQLRKVSMDDSQIWVEAAEISTTPSTTTLPPEDIFTGPSDSRKIR